MYVLRTLSNWVPIQVNIEPLRYCTSLNGSAFVLTHLLSRSGR
jgi:hypothetical protein